MAITTLQKKVTAALRNSITLREAIVAKADADIALTDLIKIQSSYDRYNFRLKNFDTTRNS